MSRGSRTLLPWAVAALAAQSALAGSGAAVGGGAPVRVQPAHGDRKTTFVVSFVSPLRTGVFGTTRLRTELSAITSSRAADCIRRVHATAPPARRGARVRVRLDPGRLGGRWCLGTYRGSVLTLQSPHCRTGQACPDYVYVRARVGRVSWRVRSHPASADRVPPAFQGLQHAVTCIPGPQRPDESIPYTLSWTAAQDDLTPAEAIVYDVYYSTVSGGEDFARPSWTTSPGLTRFRTPGLPSDSAAYFVVRARDQAGNEDRNTREQRGVNPCL